MAGITTASVKVFGWKWRPAARALANATVRHGAVRDLTRDQRHVAASSEPEPSPAAAGPSASSAERHLSAAEMFGAAAHARAAGDVPEALRMSKRIEQFFPNSEQGIQTHLVLGLLYLQENQAELALQEFATFRRIGSSEAKAEAYFGQARALRQLGRLEDERVVLEELVQSYPRSAYVAAARLRLAELEPDAAVH
jgi:outer membrane protein assembly factor BamD (BamD/ComL family)